MALNFDRKIEGQAAWASKNDKRNLKNFQQST